MSKGLQQITVKCPRPDCDDEIIVTVGWWYYPAHWSDWDGGYPEDSGWEITECPKECPSGHKYQDKDYEDIDALVEKQSNDIGM